MKQVTLFEGTVRRVEADTTGWGDSLRTVGVAVTLQVRRSDAEGNFDKETVFHLPKELGQPQVGDVLIVQVAQLGIEDMTSESELAELPDIPDPGQVFDEAADQFASALPEGEADEDDPNYQQEVR